MSRPLSIAQINTHDRIGGAGVVADSLLQGFRSRGHDVTHFVGWKHGDDPACVVVPDDDRLAFRSSGYAALQTLLRRLTTRFPNRGCGQVSRALRSLTHPRSVLDRWRGVEDFEFPSSERLLRRCHTVPDILHGHNLHGGFFDLRALAALSHRVPTALTLHDMWMVTGHCGYSLDCQRWQTGCGKCPYLRLDPAIRRDATAENWRRKQRIYRDSLLHVATPSQWLRDQVEQSSLRPAVQTARVIPNGVDTGVFHPADRKAARRQLGLPEDPYIVMVTTGSKGSMWKDDVAIREMIHRLSERPRPFQVLFLAVGRDTAVTGTRETATRRLPYQRDRTVMARCYQSADIYVHASQADTFPLTILEALACGTPVVATAVGGIPEQVRSGSIETLRHGCPGGATGVLVAGHNIEQLATAVETLLANDEARVILGRNAVADVKARFTVDRQVDAYLAWYREILEARPSMPS